jgi:hypothetical protein
MKESDLAWLAGLLEGEGSFMKGPPSSPGIPRISLQMTDEDVVAHVAVLLGLRYSKSEPRNDAWKPTFQVCLKGRRAAHLMCSLYSYMGQRRRVQIEEALSTFQCRPPGRPRVPEDVKQAILSDDRTSSEELGTRYRVSGNFVRKLRRDS